MVGHVSYGLPPDLAWMLDCTCHVGEATYDMMPYWYLFNTDTSMFVKWDQFWDKVPDTTTYRTGYISNMMMAPYHRWWHQETDMEKKAYCVLSGILQTPAIIREKVEEHFRHFVSYSIENNRQPDRSTASVYLHQDNAFKLTRRLMCGLSNKTQLVGAENMGSVLERHEELQAQYHAARTESIQKKIGKAVEDMMARIEAIDPPTQWEDEDLQQLVPERSNRRVTYGGNIVRRKTRSELKAGRKAITKSVNMLHRVGGDITAAAFVKGDEVRVEGRDFDFVVKKGSLHSHNHGALNIKVTNKIGDHLFNLCWYVEKTPAADQMAALVMAVIAGDERELLEIGNWFAVNTNAVKANPILQDMKVTKAYRYQAEMDQERIAEGLTVDEWEGYAEGTTALISERPEMRIMFEDLFYRAMGFPLIERMRYEFEDVRNVTLI